MPYKHANKLAGQRILLVGGTSGIGFVLAEQTLELGASVILASSKQASIDNALSRLSNDYPDLHSNTSGHIIDLHSPDVESAIVQLLKLATNNGTDLLDHIVITAGDMPNLTPADQFEGAATLAQAQQIRLVAPMFFAKHAPKKYLRDSNNSSLTFASGSAIPQRNFVIPNLLRNAAKGMTEGLAVDLQPVRVNLVVPGPTETELFSKRMSKEQLDAFKGSFKDTALTGVMGRPEDVSEAFLYVLKDANVTGQTLYSDGGLMFAGRSGR